MALADVFPTNSFFLLRMQGLPRKGSPTPDPASFCASIPRGSAEVREGQSIEWASAQVPPTPLYLGGTVGREREREERERERERDRQGEGEGEGEMDGWMDGWMDR